MSNEKLTKNIEKTNVITSECKNIQQDINSLFIWAHMYLVTDLKT